MPEALNANARMQAIRATARANAAAEVDRIIGRDRTAYNASQASLDAANTRVREARAHRDTLARPSMLSERRPGVPVDDWERALDACRDADAAWQRAASAHGDAFAELTAQRPADLAAARSAASDALDDHLDALPEAMTAAVEHLEAIRALSELAGPPITSTLGGDPIAAVDHLVPAISDAMRLAQRERAERTRQLTSRTEHVGAQASAAASARPVDLDAINAQLAARK